MNILVSGANGFIGRELIKALSKAGYHVRGTSRQRLENDQSLTLNNAEFVSIGNIDDETDWTEALKGIDCVVHLAGHVHVMDEAGKKQLIKYRKVNVKGTKRLAEMAVAQGVKKFIFLSTIKVNGEYTRNKLFTENDSPSPDDPYAISKFEAEQALHRISHESDFEVIIIRSPLVYGPGVKANFLKLLGIINKNIPVPFSSINNCRSMIYLCNLVDAIKKCIENPSAANQIFLVSDGQDVSTPALIRMIAKAMGKKPKLVPFPPILLKAIGKITGKSEEIGRLTSSLQVDSSKIQNFLGWTPPYTVEEGVTKTVNWYLKNRDSRI